MKAFAACALLAACFTIAGAQVTSYELELTGAQNSPAYNTAASASLVISFDASETAAYPSGYITYNLTFSAIPMPIAAHIHVGAGPGANGSVGVPLWMSTFGADPANGTVTGLVASNMVVPNAFTGPLEVLPMYNNTNVATLLSEYIETGLAYAQVHTMAAPDGFIRADFNASDVAAGIVVSPDMQVPVQAF